MDIKQELWYDLPSLPIPLSGGQLSALLETIGSDGWKVFMELKTIDARSSAVVALTPTTPPEEQTAHRALWYALSGDISFASNLKKDASEAEGVEKNELNFADDDMPDPPIPSIIQFNKQSDKQNAPTT